MFDAMLYELVIGIVPNDMDAALADALIEEYGPSRGSQNKQIEIFSSSSFEWATDSVRVHTFWPELKRRSRRMAYLLVRHDSMHSAKSCCN